MSSGRTPPTASSSHISSPKDHGSPLVDGHAEPAFAHTSSVVEGNRLPAEKNSTATLAGDEPPRRRHRPRNSGGFLLQTLPAETVRLESLPCTEPEISDKARGKRRVENGDLIVPKRASARQRHRQKPSLGSSPLTTEVSIAQSSERANSSLSRELPLAQPHARGSIRSSVNSNDTSSNTAFSREEANQNRRINAFGPDTDPTQIVNLALNLSESRRRNFSTGGLIAQRDLVGGKRIISPGQPQLGLPNGAPGGNLKQYLNQQRHISQNVSPRSGRSVSGKGASPQLSQLVRDESRRSLALPDFRAGLDADVVLDASDATLARAEKARVAIELSYEYRRLLQWLPKLPTPSQKRLSTGKEGTKYYSQISEVLGRAYNPLQYIRNRKVRFKEERPLDSEGQGWTNIDNVRGWVDTVGNEREDGISRVDRRFPLPPFDPTERGLAISNDRLISGAPNSQARKIARPHTVWEFAPWDLLADAYWLNQDDNVTRIEDSHGKKLFTDYRPLQEDRPRTSKESTRSPIRRSESLGRLKGAPEKVRTSFESVRSNSRGRGRRQRDAHEPRSPTSDDNESQNRRSRWPRKFVRSRSPSSSGETHRRRKHVRGLSYLSTRDDYESAVLEKHMMEMLAKEAEDSKEAIKRINEQTAKAPGLDKAVANSNRAHELIKRAPRRRPSAPQRMQTDVATAERHQVSARASLDEEAFDHHRMSSDDFGSTEPNSPTAPGFVPSISINLSPPASPPASAASTRKMLPTGLGSFRRNRSVSRSLRGINDNEFVLDSGTSTDVSRQTTNDSQMVNTLHKERSTDPSNGLLSPGKSEFLSRGSRQLGNSSNRSVRGTNPSDSRFRGLFKGGRIAEIVGSEVSKVGDMFWRRDNGNDASQVISPSVSTYASEDSDVDDGDVSGLDNSPENDLSRAVSRTDGNGRPSQGFTTSETPKFHMNNLPTFRSTLHKDKSPESIKFSPSYDHITRQQVAMREKGRPSRFDRLAPPKIDMKGISPSPSRSPSPEHTDNISRHSSSSKSDHRVRSADGRLNAMLNIPGKIRAGDPAPTGLSALASRQSESRGRPSGEKQRQWSISDRSVSTARGALTKRDIARVRALLLSSGVKANEIVRRADEVPAEPSLFLQDLQHLFEEEVPHLPRSQEYVVAGRMLIKNIETTIQHLRDAIERFSHTTISDLHDRLKAIDERVDYELTPLVRAAADDADTFSTELTTTHTLSVKQLNDSINVILRQRRRRLRWVRRTGWTMLEWTLLGIMWLAWFIVVIIKLVRGTLGGLVGAVRWVLWL